MGLVEGGTGCRWAIADAMDAPALESLTDPHQRMFRAFADATKSDRRALAACIRGARALMPADEVAGDRLPGPCRRRHARRHRWVTRSGLARLMPQGRGASTSRGATTTRRSATRSIRRRSRIPRRTFIEGLYEGRLENIVRVTRTDFGSMAAKRPEQRRLARGA